MKFIVFTQEGCEEVLKKEAEELTNSKPVIGEKNIIFETELEPIVKFIYYSQSSMHVLALLDSFKIKDFEDFEKKIQQTIKKIEVEKWFSKKTSFRVRCNREGEHDFVSRQAEESLGEAIYDLYEKETKEKPKVSLKNADLTFMVIIDYDNVYIGVDLVGKNLTKREYKIYSSKGDASTVLYYSMLRFTDYTKDKTLFDLNCKTGVLPIEAALFANKISPNKYSKDFAFKKLKPFEKVEFEKILKDFAKQEKNDKLEVYGFDPLLKNIEASKRNAKLSGASKLINFSKMDVDWIDTKFEEKQIDIIASRVPSPSNHFAENTAKKYYEEILYQAKFALKDKGVMAFLSEDLFLLKEMAEKDFKIEKELAVSGGQQHYDLFIFRKK
jgi:putative N6-adenine-specific DNA methylase